MTQLQPVICSLRDRLESEIEPHCGGNTHGMVMWLTTWQGYCRLELGVYQNGIHGKREDW